MREMYLTAAFAALALFSCTKEMEVPTPEKEQQPEAEKVWTVTVEAARGADDLTKAVLIGDGWIEEEADAAKTPLTFEMLEDGLINIKNPKNLEIQWAVNGSDFVSSSDSEIQEVRRFLALRHQRYPHRLERAIEISVKRRIYGIFSYLCVIKTYF